VEKRKQRGEGLSSAGLFERVVSSAGWGVLGSSKKRGNWGKKGGQEISHLLLEKKIAVGDMCES